MQARRLLKKSTVALCFYLKIIQNTVSGLHAVKLNLDETVGLKKRIAIGLNFKLLANFNNYLTV